MTPRGRDLLQRRFPSEITQQVTIVLGELYYKHVNIIVIDEKKVATGDVVVDEYISM